MASGLTQILIHNNYTNFYSVYGTLSVIIGVILYSDWVLKWLTEGSFLMFLKRFIPFAITIGIMYLLEQLSPVTRETFTEKSINGFVWSIVLFSGLLGIFSIISFFGIFVIAFKIDCTILSILIAFINGILWRIVEYNKGSAAAITLIITAILGVMELFLKIKK